MTWRFSCASEFFKIGIKTMPYLLHNSQNRVENIKKKFENSHLSEDETNNLLKKKSLSAPSITRPTQIFENGVPVNECHNSENRYQDDRHGKFEVNKSDVKAVVRRTPAFRREKLIHGKSISNVCNRKNNTSYERRKLKSKGSSNTDLVSEPISDVNIKNKPHHNFPRNSISSKTSSNSRNILPASPDIGKSENCENFPFRNSQVVEGQSKNLKETDNDSVAVKCSDNENKHLTRRVHECDLKSDLKLTDSIRLALKSPLPKGPPPKKPPRTFAHTSKDITPSFKTQDLSTKQEMEDSSLKLKLEKIEKTIKGLDIKNHSNLILNANAMQSDINKTKICDASHQLIYESHKKPENFSCFKSLNCMCTNDYEKFVKCDSESHNQSSFHVDFPISEQQLIKTDENINGKVTHDNPRKSISEPIYDLPFVPQKRSFESIPKVLKGTGSTSSTQNQLHYMCTDVINSIQEKSNSSKLSNPNDKGMILDSSHTNISNDCASRFIQNLHLNEKNFPPRPVNEGVCEEVKKLFEHEQMKAIMNDAFSFSDSKRSVSQHQTSNLEFDSDPESASSGLEEIISTSARGGKFSNKNTQLDKRLSTVKKEEDLISQATRMRKNYIKRVSNNLLNQPTSLKISYNESFTHLFESCILVGLTLGDLKTTMPYIKSIYPPNGNKPDNPYPHQNNIIVLLRFLDFLRDSHVLSVKLQIKPPPLIESLCFPDASTWTENSKNHQQGEQYYSLVITNENGDRKFGYCRRVLPEGGNFCLPLVYCIISSHRANGFYYKILQELESRHGSSELQKFIQELYECSFPCSGESLKFKKILDEVTRNSPTKSDIALPSTIVRRPCDVRLEERDLTQLLQRLKVSLLLKVFSSLLLERKVLLLSHSLRDLSSCIEALQSLLIPFSWQHTLIPVLPNHLSEMCDAPTPYIIGLQRCNNTEEILSNMNFEEGIMIDLEESVIIKCCGDEGNILPRHLMKGLKTALNLAASDSIESDNNKNVFISEAFIRFFVEICGNYCYFIAKQSDGKKIFQKEEFVNSATSSVQPFIDWFVETAMFRTFIQERFQNDVDDLFKKRVMERKDETEKNRNLLMKNYKGMNKKVKMLGDRIKDLALFAK